MFVYSRNAQSSQAPMIYQFCLNDQCVHKATAPAFHEACFPALRPAEFLQFIQYSFDPAPGVYQDRLRRIQCLIVKLRQQPSGCLSLAEPYVYTMDHILGNPQIREFVSYSMRQLWKGPRSKISKSIELSGTLWAKHVNIEGINYI